MALRALLLSPDDQAVNAITAVLEEMSVGCERPLDGMSAAKKINSEHFDLVLVDCENLPAAKLIFDVCRRSHGAAVPVAVVDGRVGLPTAFRLGAELILTKPVAKDQARITIRSAVSRTKKELTVQDAKPADAVGDSPMPPQDARESVAPKPLAQAAAAGAGATVDHAAVAVASTPVSLQAPAAGAPLSTTAMAATSSAPLMSSATTELPAISPSLSPTLQPAITSADRIEAAENPSMVAPPKPQLSHHPVADAVENNEPTLRSPVFSAYQQPNEKRSRGLLVGTLVLAIATGGIYAGWMYRPGFREFIQVRLDQAKTLLGLQNERAVSPIRQIAPAVRAKAAVRQTPSPRTAAVVAQQTATSGTDESTSLAAATPPQAGGMTSPTAPTAGTDHSTASEPQRKLAVPLAAGGDLPGAKNAVILSSKGAEKRLLRRVMPVVPAEARAPSTEATVVLKTMVDENGAVQSVQALEGNSALAVAAMDAVRQWRYKPYIRDGKALPFQTIVLVDFQ
jgi:TonB family protein